MLYEDKIELMYGGEVGREMIDCGLLGSAAVKNVVELPSAQSPTAATVGAELNVPAELSA
jgi:hypothetical protein